MISPIPRSEFDVADDGVAILTENGMRKRGRRAAVLLVAASLGLLLGGEKVEALIRPDAALRSDARDTVYLLGMSGQQDPRFSHNKLGEAATRSEEAVFTAQCKTPDADRSSSIRLLYSHDPSKPGPIDGADAVAVNISWVERDAGGADQVLYHSSIVNTVESVEISIQTGEIAMSDPSRSQARDVLASTRIVFNTILKDGPCADLPPEL